MAHLDDALTVLHLSGTVELDGLWLTLLGERWRVYVMGTPWGSRYYTWGGDPGDRMVEAYPDPTAAIRRGLQRAAKTKHER